MIIDRLSIKEIIKSISVYNRRYLIIAGCIIDDNIILVNGRFDIIKIDKSWFPANKLTKPNFNSFEIIDHGNTLKFGDYEAASDVIICEYEILNKK